MTEKYRNVFEFTARRLLHRSSGGAIVLGGAIVAVAVAVVVLAWGNWRPLVELEMRAVTAVRASAVMSRSYRVMI